MRVLAVIATYKEVNEIPSYLINNLQGWLRQEGDFNLDIVMMAKSENHRACPVDEALTS